MSTTDSENEFFYDPRTGRVAGNATPDLVERLNEDAEYLDTYTGFVGNNLAIARRISEAASELSRLRADIEFRVERFKALEQQYIDDAVRLRAELDALKAKFDMAGNYIPHSQIDGDLRAAKAALASMREALTRIASLSATDTGWLGIARDALIKGGSDGTE